MKILLTTLNAKYVHTSLALWYLYQYCRDEFPTIEFREFNINQDIDWVCGEIYREKADVVAFSCNIWNIEEIRVLGRRLKALAPKTLFVLGGPEVWEEPEALLTEQPWVDFIVVGEGEITFKEWLRELTHNPSDWSKVKGLVYREQGQPVRTAPQPAITDLSILPFPYPENVEAFRYKLVYYESARGCPYSCQYCLSANEHGVRFFAMDQVKRDLLRFIQAEVAQVKFVDRSFNCNREWAKTIWQFLIDHPGKTNFHFEIVGDLLDDESLAILEKAPRGLFQFEIGVQSTHPETLRLIQRKTDFAVLSERVQRLLKKRNVFVHLDLIAGLPGEDYRTFAKSFNDNMALEPNRLQLGFLKLLHGSGLRATASEYGYLYTEEAPYEVLSNDWISYEDLLRLKTIEDLLERYYNSERYRYSLRYLIAGFESPFAMFEKLAAWWKERGYDEISHKTKDMYGYLLTFGISQKLDGLVLRNLLKFDYLSSERLVELPEWAGPVNPEVRKHSYTFWQNQANRERYLPEWSDLPVRDIQRRVMIEEFEIDPEIQAGMRDVPLHTELRLFKYQPSGPIITKIPEEEFWR